MSEHPSQLSTIFFGALVELEDEDGEVLSFRIVGPDEIDPEKQYISMDSPMAKQLMAKSLGDEVLVKTPDGDRYWTVVSVRYI